MRNIKVNSGLIGRLTLGKFLAIFIMAILMIGAVEDIQAAEAPEATRAQTENVGRTRLLELMREQDVNTDLATEALRFIDELITSTRLDQDNVYKFVRTLNRNFDDLGDSDFLNEVRAISANLMSSSYTDELLQNQNLSNQLKTRLPNLTADSLLINSDPENVYRKQDFLAEYKLLSDRFLSSKRFKLGVGFSYNYIPVIQYRGTAILDFTPYISDIPRRTDGISMSGNFANGSYPGLSFFAKTDISTIEVMVPSYDGKVEITTPVLNREIIDTETEFLHRSTMVSDLKIEYDANLRFSIERILVKYLSRDRRNYRTDSGIGFGITGISVEDNITTDIRFRNDPSSTFNDLQSFTTFNSSSNESYQVPYFLFYSDYEISDVASVGLIAKYHWRNSKNGGKLNVDGLSVSLNVTWYPSAEFYEKIFGDNS